MPDVIDFLVLRQFYDEARQRNWQSCKSVLVEFYIALKCNVCCFPCVIMEFTDMETGKKCKWFQNRSGLECSTPWFVFILRTDWLERHSERGRETSSAGWFTPQMLVVARGDQPHARSMELPSGLPCGCQGSPVLGHRLLLSPAAFWGLLPGNWISSGEAGTEITPLVNDFDITRKPSLK